MGALWRFPFGALPIDASGTPLASKIPLVVTTADASNVAAADGMWIGHFDLSLPHAIADLIAVKRHLSSQRTELRLVDTAGAMVETAHGARFAVVYFAGHGIGSGARQHLRFSDGTSVFSSDLLPIAEGASVILNACWLGGVTDDLGSEPVDLALTMLARGAHSVVATLGVVQDQRASRFVAALLPSLDGRTTAARAVQIAVQRLLDEDPELRLDAWASFITVGRSADYSVT